MPEVVISDTSTLILFKKIDELELLSKVYGNLIITSEIAEEFGELLPNWIKIKTASDEKHITLLETQVDKGEASILALASEFDNALLLLDDLKARKLAKKLDFNVTGTLGVIHKAKQLHKIDRVKPLINKLLQTDFRIADKVVEEFLILNNE